MCARERFMLFLEEEKIFSLFKTTASLPRNDIKALLEELYCYLLIAGLFREGEGRDGVHFKLGRISSDEFVIPSASYAQSLGPVITKGVVDRFSSLIKSPMISDVERDVLRSIDGIFTDDPQLFHSLKGSDLYGIAVAREFSADMMVIARYVAVMFGQSNYPVAKYVPRVYLSAFGNIHMVKPKPLDGKTDLAYHAQDLVHLDIPLLRYGSKSKEGDVVTALWSLLSAQIHSLADAEMPGELLGDTLSSMMFFGGSDEFEKLVPAPRYASSLYMQRRIGMDGCNKVSLSAGFYKQFLYGSTEVTSVSRKGLLETIINLMMEKMGETHLDHLFFPNSYYRKLVDSSVLYTKTIARPALFQFALETLKADLKDDSLDLDTPTDTSSANATQDEELVIPQEEDPFGDDSPADEGGYDPSMPPPAQPAMDKNTIDLLSFDKSGESVNEDLYRAAVVALNARLRSDDTLPVDAEARDKLDQWVNGWLYRTAISATKDLITFLHLQQHLKNIPTKG